MYGPRVKTQEGTNTTRKRLTRNTKRDRKITRYFTLNMEELDYTQRLSGTQELSGMG